MNFHRRKIGNERLHAFTRRRSLQDKENPTTPIKIFTPKKTIVLSAIVAMFMIFMAYRTLQSVSIRDIVFLFGRDLQQDSYGHTNILLLGSGGEGHDGPDLTDTIIIANIDQKKNDVRLLSIPRDFYVEDKKLGGMRINNLYHVGKNQLESESLGRKMLIDHIEDITNLKIHNYLKIDFNGFKKVIDEIGGIDIDIPENLYDPEYPRGEDIGYEIFSLKKGLQHLDGEKALKYARSRKTTSDFDRSKRQQLLLFALKEKAEKEGILGDTSKIKGIYEAIEPYIGTDLGLQEMITLGKIGAQIKKESIATWSIHDDPGFCGGLLYTPARELYNGASVLVAATKDNKDIHNFTTVQLDHPELHAQGIKIQVLNGTKTPGLAAETKILLNRLCLKVIRFGNGQSKDVQTTTYFLKKEIPTGAITALQTMIPGVTSMIIPPKYLEPQYASDADIIIELGADYLPGKMKDPYDYIVPLYPTPVSGEAGTTKPLMQSPK